MFGFCWCLSTWGAHLELLGCKKQGVGFRMHVCSKVKSSIFTATRSIGAARTHPLPLQAAPHRCCLGPRRQAAARPPACTHMGTLLHQAAGWVCVCMWGFSKMCLSFPPHPPHCTWCCTACGTELMACTCTHTHLQDCPCPSADVNLGCCNKRAAVGAVVARWSRFLTPLWFCLSFGREWVVAS